MDGLLGVGNGWVAGGCWDDYYILLLVMTGIIPENSLLSTSKYIVWKWSALIISSLTPKFVKYTSFDLIQQNNRV